MASTSVPTNFGAVSFMGVDFNTIDINPQDLARKIAPFIVQGSKIHYLTLDDIKVHVIKYDASSTVPNNEKVSVNNGFHGLMREGKNKFFDVLVYMAMTPGSRPDVIEIDEVYAEPATPYGDIARALFVQYFFVLTRGRVSQANGTALGTDMPKFLHTVLNCSESPLAYHDRISSFDMHKLGYEWVKHVPFTNIAREATSRFGLGVAGYRMLAPFKLLRPRANLTQSLTDAYNVAHSMAVTPATWDIHPATRNNNILQTYGPLNANLGNLMLEVFELAELNELVTRRVIFVLPTRDPTATQYKTWTGLYAPPATSNIF